MLPRSITAQRYVVAGSRRELAPVSLLTGGGVPRWHFAPGDRVPRCVSINRDNLTCHGVVEKTKTRQADPCHLFVLTPLDFGAKQRSRASGAGRENGPKTHPPLPLEREIDHAPHSGFNGSAIGHGRPHGGRPRLQLKCVQNQAASADRGSRSSTNWYFGCVRQFRLMMGRVAEQARHDPMPLGGSAYARPSYPVAA